jgi:hypothetical protein
MKQFITLVAALMLASPIIAQIDGPVGVCPGSTHTYSVSGYRAYAGPQDWSVSGGVFTENGLTTIQKPPNTSVQVTWGNTPLWGNVDVINLGGEYYYDLNVGVGTFLNLLSPGSATIYQQTDFSACKGNTLGTLTWTAQSGSVVWSNSDATWVKITFYGYGNKLVTVQGTDAVCGTVYTDQAYVNVGGGSLTGEEDSGKMNLLGKQIAVNDLSAFPNPVRQTENLIVQIPEMEGITEPTEIRLMTTDGKIVKKYITTDQRLEIITSDIDKGFFIVQVISGRYNKSIPIVIQ